MNDEYIITEQMIDNAFDKGVVAAKSITLNYSKDYYDNYRYPYLTLTCQLSYNPYTVTGSGKKLKAAWHNGYRSAANHS